nr:hypothetical protein [Tanacetum cinerariifolium]
MTILDNSPGTYDSKYKEVCDLLKKFFARHLKQYGHIRHTQVAKVKQTIPKLKWKTKENFHDCRIFTLLHMETFDGGPDSNLDCGLPMLELAKEFDKTDPVEKIAIIVDAFKKREEQESYEIPVESHEIQYESLEIQEESHEIQYESLEIQEESHEIQVESHKIQVESQ